MSESAPSLVSPSLGSTWDGLSEHLIASFFEVKKLDNNAWGRTAESDPATVFAPLTEANMEVVLNWQSPFEQTGPESKAPALTAMLQSGALQPLVDTLLPKGWQESAKNFFKQLEGRTGITKLNSTQVFSGMPPIKIQVVALFRAWSTPAIEVEEPFNKLMEWALPIHLAENSTILSRAAELVKGGMNWVDALLPSTAPTMIAMKYKGRIYSPLVIESIGMPINSPVDADGQYVELLVPMTLATLTAMGRKDWSNSRIVL